MTIYRILPLFAKKIFSALISQAQIITKLLHYLRIIFDYCVIIFFMNNIQTMNVVILLQVLFQIMTKR